MPASTVEVIVTIKVDGRRLPGFPLTRRMTCERLQDVSSEHAAESADDDLGTNYEASYNTTSITYPKLLFYTADQKARVHSLTDMSAVLEVGADAIYPLHIDANGFILVVGGSSVLDDGATAALSNATFRSNVLSDANERWVLGSDTGTS